MRIFSIGTWSHFGSFVISIAMLGFGVMSAIDVHGHAEIPEILETAHYASALVVFGPLMLLSNSAGPVARISTRLSSSPTRNRSSSCSTLFLVYFIPFLPGALFLGLVFMRGQAVFGKVYFADLTGLRPVRPGVSRRPVFRAAGLDSADPLRLVGRRHYHLVRRHAGLDPAR